MSYQRLVMTTIDVSSAHGSLRDVLQRELEKVRRKELAFRADAERSDGDINSMWLDAATSTARDAAKLERWIKELD